jgi:hypothetical protein
MMNLGNSNSFVLAVQQYQALYDRALELFNVFEDADVTELQRRREELDTQVKRFLNVSGLDWSACYNLDRHLHFLKYWLDCGDKQGCFSDVKDIVFNDLPTALKNLVKSTPQDSHFDQNLRDAVFPLVQGGHYDSAIRKAFIVLSDRLRRAFGVVEEHVDGEALANMVFGKGRKIPVVLDEAKKQCYRNLISGFYGVYRNKFAHYDVVPSLSEVKAILEMVNTIIIEIEKISAASIQADV